MRYLVAIADLVLILFLIGLGLNVSMVGGLAIERLPTSYEFTGLFLVVIGMRMLWLFYKN